MPPAEVVELKPKEKSPAEWHQYWQDEKSAADKRVSKFQKQGNQINHRFLDDRRDQLGTTQTSATVPSRLNLFYTNIVTLQSMLFGTTPQISVDREHADPDDDIARVAAMLFKRILDADNYDMDDDFATVLKAALQDRLIPGLGMARVRYSFESAIEVQPDPATGEETTLEVVTSESCDIDYVHWQDVLWGWGRTWSEIPWLGYRSFLTKSETETRFGEKIAKALVYKDQKPGMDNRGEGESDPEQKSNVQKAEIWEFWCKTTRKVYWWSDGADIILDIKDDPLELSTFWPSPAPLIANPTTSLFMPKADFTMAQDLYNEIDELQSRISIITDAVRVVGVYDKAQDASVGRMLKEGYENDLIPVDNYAMFAEKGGLKGVIDWFPVGDVVTVLQTLAAVRDSQIDLLYQVTGMSDVLRGANTDQYQSDGSNQLKAKFGSIRVQAIQEEFARFASALDALKTEVVSKHFSPRSILIQANAKYIPAPDQPKIPEAVALMKSDDIRWRVTIRPESIAMVDYAALKSERTEFLTAMATFLQSATSMIKEKPATEPMLLEMLKWGMAGFKGADYMEGMMDQAIDDAKKAPPKPQDDGKAQAEQAKGQAELQKIEAKSQADMALVQAKGQQELQKIQMDFQTTMQEMQAKSQGDIQKITADLQADLRVIAAKLGADLQVEEAQSTFAVAEKEVEHEFNQREQLLQHGNTMDQIDEQNESRDNMRDGDD